MRNLFKLDRWGWLTFIVAISLAVFFFTYNLQKEYMNQWDECRLATNAYEMNRYGGWIVPTVERQPDMTSLKPPLMIWVQVMSVKLLGYNDFAIRFPAALAALATCILLFIFIHVRSGNHLSAFFSVLILATSRGWLEEHGVRFGEYDSLLSFFTTAAFISFYSFLETKRWRLFGVLVLSLSFACLTKGIAGLLFVPGFLLMALFYRGFLYVISSPYTYAGLVFFLLLVGGYYLLREYLSPGYLTAVIDNELGRYGKTIEEHKWPWHFYIDQFRSHRFSVWYWIVPVALFASFFFNAIYRRLILSAYLVAVTYFIIISYSQTKLVWYDLPVYPLFAICGALLLSGITELLTRHLDIVITRCIQVLLIVVLSWQPVREAWLQINKDPYDKYCGVEPCEKLYSLSWYMRDSSPSAALNNSVCVTTGYFFQWLHYVHVLQEKGVSIRHLPIESVTPNMIQPNERLFWYQPSVTERLNQLGTIKVVDSSGYVFVGYIL